MPHLTYLQAIVIGLLQGVTELFPVSSLGHSVLLPALIGGDWARTLDLSSEGSPYLAFLVAVHVATAAALVVFYRHDWVRIVRGLATSVQQRQIATADQRLGWLLVVATIPVGLAGLALEHTVRTTLGRPVPAAVFLILNGAVLYTVEKLRSRSSRTGGAHRAHTAPAYAGAEPAITSNPTLRATATTSGSHPLPASDLMEPMEPQGAADGRLAGLGWLSAVAIGAAQILALLPGISRSGATIAAGLVRGLDHDDAARFAFLLATPVIAAAGLFKLPELAGPAGSGILGPVLAGSAAAGVAAYLALRYLTRYFHTHTLTPFAIYCVLAGSASLAWLTLA